MKIKTDSTASRFESKYTFDLDDFDMTEEDWHTLSYLEKRSIIRRAVRELPDQPYWSLESFSEV